MEALLGFFVTIGIFTLVTYLVVVGLIILVPVAVIAIVVYLIKESKKGNETGIPVKHENVLYKNVIEGDEVEHEIVDAEDFEAFDENLNKRV